ncbi:hypothetical protein C3L33_16106, partial [Rhododendron williamsianum]
MANHLHPLSPCVHRRRSISSTASPPPLSIKTNASVSCTPYVTASKPRLEATPHLVDPIKYFEPASVEISDFLFDAAITWTPEL